MINARTYIRLLHISYFIIVYTVAYSQGATLASEVHPEHRLYPLKGEVYINKYHRVKGSQYLTDEWLHGSIELNDGEIIPDVQYRFDSYAHNLLVYNDYLKRIVRIAPSTVRSFTMFDMGSIYLFQHFVPDFGTMHGRKHAFLKVLSKGDQLFLKYHFNELKQFSTPGEYTEEFKPGVRYYCSINNQLQRTRLRKSFFRKNFPEQYEKVKEYISANKINVNQETGFTRVMDMLNSAQEHIQTTAQ